MPQPVPAAERTMGAHSRSGLDRRLPVRLHGRAWTPLRGGCQDGPARGRGKGQRAVSLEVKRLHLGATPGGAEAWPVHGFVVTYPGGAALVDTGIGGPPEVIRDWEVVNVATADALGGLGLVPGDIDLVINTHLHFDHCGQNAVFKHAAFYVQRVELDRCRRQSPVIYDWFDFQNATFELLDGDAEIRPGLSVIATPGHTSGHQSVLVAGVAGAPPVRLGPAPNPPPQSRRAPG